MRIASLCVVASVMMAGTGPNRPSDEPGPRKACVSFWGPVSAVHERGFVLALDEEQWLGIWARHQGKKPEDYGFRRIGVPEIDFSRFMVVGVFSGESANTDGEVVDSVEQGDGGTLLRYDSLTYQVAEFGPGPHEPRPTLYPFGLWVIPRASGTIRIEENVQGIIDRAPIWKLQHEFPGPR